MATRSSRSRRQDAGVVLTSHAPPGSPHHLNYALIDDAGDSRAAEVAQKGMNELRIDLCGMSREERDNRLVAVIDLREHFSVSVHEMEFGEELHCSCGDWTEVSPCSHIYWLLNEITRSKITFGSLKPTRQLQVSARNAAVTAVRSSGPYPILVLPLLEERSIDDVVADIRSRRIPDDGEGVNLAMAHQILSVLWESVPPGKVTCLSTSLELVSKVWTSYARRDPHIFRQLTNIMNQATCLTILFEKAKGEVQQIFSKFDENALNLPTPSGRRRQQWSPQFCKRKLEENVVGIMVRRCDGVIRQQREFWETAAAGDAGDTAASMILYMLQGIVARGPLHRMIMVDTPDEIWNGAFYILDMIRPQFMSTTQKVELRRLFEIVSNDPEFSCREDLFSAFENLVSLAG